MCIYTYLLMHLSVGRQTHLPAARLARTQASARTLSSAANCASILESLKLLAPPLAYTNIHSHVDTHRHICTPIYRWDTKYGSIRHDAPGSSHSRTATAKRTRTSRCSERAGGSGHRKRERFCGMRECMHGRCATRAAQTKGRPPYLLGFVSTSTSSRASASSASRSSSASFSCRSATLYAVRCMMCVCVSACACMRT